MRPCAADPPRRTEASGEIGIDGSEIGCIDREAKDVSSSPVIAGELQPVATEGKIERGAADMLARELDAASSGERQIAPATLRRELERERRRPFGLERTLRGNAARDRRTRIGAERSRIEARGSGSDAEAVPGSELEPGIAGKRASFRLGAKGFDLQRSATDLGVEGERDATIAKLALERSLRFASSVRQLEVERAGQTRGIQSRMDAGEIDVLDPDATAKVVGGETGIAANAAPAGECDLQPVETQDIGVIGEPRRCAG